MKLQKVYYLPTRYDNMDEYYQLQDVTKEQLLGFFNLLFSKNKINQFKDLKNLSKWQVMSTFKTDSENILDIVGGCFGILGYYTQGFYGDNFPKECQGSSDKAARNRFKWLKQEILNYENT